MAVFFLKRILSYMYVHPVPHQMIFHPEGQGAPVMKAKGRILRNT